MWEARYARRRSRRVAPLPPRLSAIGRTSTGKFFGSRALPALDCESMDPIFSIQGVIFDMDGVLCDSEPFIAEAAGRMFAERHGLAVTPEDFHPFVGTGEDRFLGGVAGKYGVTLDMPADKERT